MALVDVLNQLDDETVLTIIRKGLYVNMPDPRDAARKEMQLSSKEVKKISNSLTSLQGALNQIYAATMNVRNLQQYQQKSLQAVERENSIESNSDMSSLVMPVEATDNQQLLQSISSLSSNIDLLATRLSELNLGKGGVAGVVDTVVDVAGDVATGLSLSRGIGVLGKLPWKKIGYGAAVLGGGAMAFGMSGTANAAERTSAPSATSADKQLTTAAEKSTKAQAQMEQGAMPSGPSYSDRFANFLSETIQNVKGWVANTFGGGGDVSGGATGNFALSGNTKADFTDIMYRASKLGDPYPEITAAQWALESGYGQHMPQGSNNPFGQTATENQPHVLARDNQTGEMIRYYKYDSIDAALAAHINKWNKGLPAGMTPEQAIQSIVKKGYNPYPDYPSKVMRMLADNNINSKNANAGANFISSNSGSITGRYGEQREGHIHEGLDFAAKMGTPVFALKSGKISVAGQVSGYGNAIYIDHDDGTQTRYGHLSVIRVTTGSQIDGGKQIGNIGSTGRSTGPHLHFELLQNGQHVDPTGTFLANRWIVGGAGSIMTPTQQVTRSSDSGKKIVQGVGIARPTKEGNVTTFIRRNNQNDFEIWNTAGLDHTPITLDQARTYAKQHNHSLLDYFGI